MKLDTKKIAIFIKTKTGNHTYQVCLSNNEKLWIAEGISQMQNGKIKVFKEHFDSIEWRN